MTLTREGNEWDAGKSKMSKEEAREKLFPRGTFSITVLGTDLAGLPCDAVVVDKDALQALLADDPAPEPEFPAGELVYAKYRLSGWWLQFQENNGKRAFIDGSASDREEALDVRKATSDDVARYSPHTLLTALNRLGQFLYAPPELHPDDAETYEVVEKRAYEAPEAPETWWYNHEAFLNPITGRVVPRDCGPTRAKPINPVWICREKSP
jgi:hypothetical protein